MIFWRLVLCVFAATMFALTERPERVLVVRSSDAAPYKQAAEAIKDTLSGRGVRVSEIVLGSSPGQDMLRDLERRGDTLIAVGTPAAVFCESNRGSRAELSYCLVGGIAAEPLGENKAIRGITTDVSVSEQLGLIRDFLPRAKRAAMIYRSSDRGSEFYRRSLADGAGGGWEIVAIDLDSHSSIASAIGALIDSDPDVVWSAPDRAVSTPAIIKVLLTETLKNSIPVYGFSSQFVRSGALLGMSVDPGTQGTQVANLVLEERAGAGTHSGHTAPETVLAINLLVADRLNISVPKKARKEAKYVFGE